MLDDIKKHIPYRTKKTIKFFQNPCYSLNIFIQDTLSRVGYYKYPYRIIFVAGLPKSGTTWIENFLYNVPGYCPRELFGPKEIIIKQDIPDNAFKYFPQKGYSFVKTHMNPTENNFKVLEKNEVSKLIVLYRDPRDIVVSRYFHLVKYPKKTGEPHCFDYRKIDKITALSHSIDVIVSDYLPWIKGWRSKIHSSPNNYLLITYEKLIDNPLQVFTNILNFYSINNDKYIIEHMLRKTEKMKKSRMKVKGRTGLKSTFRKGCKGDWKSHFDNNLKEKFKQEAGDFLVELGYEKDLNW